MVLVYFLLIKETSNLNTFSCIKHIKKFLSSVYYPIINNKYINIIVVTCNKKYYN